MLSFHATSYIQDRPADPSGGVTALKHQGHRSRAAPTAFRHGSDQSREPLDERARFPFVARECNIRAVVRLLALFHVRYLYVIKAGVVKDYFKVREKNLQVTPAEQIAALLEKHTRKEVAGAIGVGEDWVGRIASGKNPGKTVRRALHESYEKMKRGDPLGSNLETSKFSPEDTPMQIIRKLQENQEATNSKLDTLISLFKEFLKTQNKSHVTSIRDR